MVEFTLFQIPACRPRLPSLHYVVQHGCGIFQMVSSNPKL